MPAKKRLTFPYALPEGQAVGDLTNDEEDGDLGNWRRKLFVWTQLGEWCSEDCYALEHRHFKTKNHEEREERLRCLEAMRSPSVRQREGARFLSSMTRLWADLGDEAGEMLLGDDALDESYYAEQFDQRVERDLALVGEKEFRQRYLRGYELCPVPRFRPDVLGWREFIDSLTRQLCLDQARSRSQSRLLHAVRNAFEAIGRSTDVLEKPAELRELLRDIFAAGDAGDVAMAKATKLVTRYHRE